MKDVTKSSQKLSALMAQLKQSVAELESWQGIPWEDARQVLLA